MHLSQRLLSLSLVTVILSHCMPASAQGDGKPFEGHTLRCCSIIADPFTKETGKPGEYDGLAIKYINNLQNQTGFKCSSMEIYKPPDNSVGFESFLRNNISDCATTDGRANVSPDCRCDIGVAAWFGTYNRSFLNVDFVYPFIHDDYAILTRVELTSARHDGLFFINAFGPVVWLCITALMLLFTMLRLLDVHYHPVRTDDSSAQLEPAGDWKTRLNRFLLKLRRVRLSTIDTLKLLVGGESARANTTSRSTMRRHVLNYIVTLSGLFLILIYEATMTASLVSESYGSDFKEIQNVRECHISHKDIGIVTGDASESYWTTVVGSKCTAGDKENVPKKYTSYDALMKALAVTKEVKYVLLDRATAARYIDRYCSKLVFTGKPFLRRGASIVLPAGSNYTDVFNRHTMLLNEQGKLPTIDASLGNLRCMSVGGSVIDFRRLRIFFLLAVVACVCVFIVMVAHPQNVQPQNVQRESEQSNIDETAEDRDDDAGSSSGDVSITCEKNGSAEKDMIAASSDLLHSGSLVSEHSTEAVASKV